MSRSLRLYKRSPLTSGVADGATPSNLTSNAHPGPTGTGPAVASIGRISPPAADRDRGDARSAISAVSAATRLIRPDNDKTVTPWRSP